MGPVIEAPATVRRALVSEVRAGAGDSPPPCFSCTVARAEAAPDPPPRASGSGGPPPPPPPINRIRAPQPAPPALTHGEDPKRGGGAVGGGIPVAIWPASCCIAARRASHR